MAKSKFERSSETPDRQGRVRRVGRGLATGAGVTALAIGVASPARAQTAGSSVGGAAAPVETNTGNGLGGVAPPAETPSGTGGVAASSSSSEITPAQLNTEVQTYGGHLARLVIDGVHARKVTQSTLSNDAGEKFAELTTTVVARRSSGGGIGEYNFDVIAPFAKGKPDLNHPQQIVLTEGYASSTGGELQPTAQLTFSKDENQDWTVGGTYWSHGTSTPIQAAVSPELGSSEAQLDESEFDAIAHQGRQLGYGAQRRAGLIALRPAFQQEPGTEIVG